ncbi:unnamed protein product [Anisakis simplex]|uniref:MgtE domain-containing protein n=1 Tax=Anisakis simplex TaxID=6269 RepID=A0A0M3JEU4_ANISI|nr:unnamed protein product [Anisakis simplex]
MSGQHISTSTKLVYCSTLNGGNVGRGIAILSVQFVIDITAALLLPILLFVNKVNCTTLLKI